MEKKKKGEKPKQGENGGISKEAWENFDKAVDKVLGNKPRFKDKK